MNDRYDSISPRLRMDDRVVEGFSTISVLKPDNDRIDYRSAGMTDVLTKILITTSFDSVLLERDVIHDPEFEAWANRTNNFDETQNEAPNNIPRNIVVEVHSRTGERPTANSNRSCWASELCTVDDIDIGDSSVAIKRLRLENQGWDQIVA